MTDAIADMLTIIRNGYKASKKEVKVPFSKLKCNLAEKLRILGFLEEVKETNEENKKYLTLKLRYDNGKPELEGIKRVSKPGLRVYKNKDKIPYVYGGLGVAILSTNQGLLSDREARKIKIGGEVICEVW